jgi:multidrug efflux pump subunit AcrA (membrane-fusion protein)
MKTTGKIAGAVLILFLMGIADLPNLSGNLVPEAQAFRGRGAAFVVGAAVGSAGSSAAEASAAASQQQAAAAQQQAAMAQQQAAAAQQQAAIERERAAAAQQQAALVQPQAAASGQPLPLGTVVSALPGGCVPTPSGGVNYYYCGGNFYQAAYQGSNLVYVTTKPK